MSGVFPSKFRWVLACLALSMGVLSVSTTQAAVLTGVDKVQFSSQWPTSYFMPTSVLGGYGPQIQLSPVAVKGTPPDVLIEQSLQRHATESGGIQVNQIVLKSAGNGPDEDLSALLESYKDKKCTVQELQELALKIGEWTNTHHGACCAVYITQKADGVLEYELAHFKLRNIAIEDGKYFKARSIRSQLGNKVGKPFDLVRLDKDLRQIQSNPDITLSSEIKPVEGTDEADLNIKIEDNRPIHLITHWNNLGAYPFGDGMMGATVVHNNITGFGDTLAVSTVFSRESHALVTHYEVPVNSHGTRLVGEYSFVRSQIEQGEYEAMDAKGTAQVFTAGLTQILYDRNQTRLMGYGFLDVKESDGNALGMDLEREQFRDIRVGLQLDRDDSHGNTSLLQEAMVGFDVFGATHDGSYLLSATGGGGNYSRYTSALTRVQNMPWGSTGILRAFYQYTPSQLNPFDYFGLGGTFGGRGYREGYYVGDSGLVLSAEWRVPCYLFPKSWKVPHTEDSLRENVELLTFLEYGFIHSNNAPPDAEATEQILGTGVGIRAKLSRFMDARLDVGFPLARQFPYGLTPRLHFGIESNIF